MSPSNIQRRIAYYVSFYWLPGGFHSWAPETQKMILLNEVSWDETDPEGRTCRRAIHIDHRHAEYPSQGHPHRLCPAWGWSRFHRSALTPCSNILLHCPADGKIFPPFFTVLVSFPLIFIDEIILTHSGHIYPVSLPQTQIRYVPVNIDGLRFDPSTVV